MTSRNYRRFPNDAIEDDIDAQQVRQVCVRSRRRRAIVEGVDANHAGVFLLVVGGALFALLLFGGRSVRSGTRDLWRKLGLLRWVLILIVVVIFVDLADGLPNQ
nr:hypothetical protein [Micromonospora sp. DSM 115978]